MQKKGWFGLFVLSLFMITLFSGIGIAQETNTQETNAFLEGLRSASNVISDPIKKFTENTVTFVKSLFFVLVFLIISVIISIIPIFNEKKGTGILLSLVVSILAVFFIPTALILPLLNPYSALGVTLISMIPFILVFMFVQNMLVNTFLKKLAWTFFAVGLLMMSIYTALLQQSDPLVYGKPIFGWVYGVISVLALIMGVFNQRIDNALFKGKMEGKLTRAQSKMQKRIALDRLKEEEAEQVIGK